MNLIDLRMVRFINGRDVAREFFALSNERLQLVRLENTKGEAVQNEYIFPNSEIGVAPDANIADQWISMLDSNDKADVLSALVFLGRRHIDEPARRLLPEPHESRYAEQFRQLIGDPRIRDLIARLSNSDNEWVKQAARLAGREPNERLIQ